MVLFFGAILSYITLLFVPSLRFFPIPFAIFLLFAYLYLKDIKSAIYLGTVFSLPYSAGKALINIDGLYIFTVTPFVVFILLSSVFSLKNKVHMRISIQELFLLLFILWGVLSFMVMNTTPLVLDGIYKISLSILLYFLTKQYIQEKKIKKAIVITLLSIAVFESLLTVIQFVIGHPIGRFVEEGLTLYPMGILTSPDDAIFRPSGTFLEPTWMARFLTMLFPVILFNIIQLKEISKKVSVFIIILIIFAIIATMTRVSWVVAGILLIVFFMKEKPNINLSILKKPLFILLFIICFSIGLFILFPYIEKRIITSGVSFEEMGSIDVRVKLIHEAIALIMLNPIFGVGLSQFSIYALESNVTNSFQFIMHSVHNVSLLIASEMGIPALILFVGFILFSHSAYLSKKIKTGNKNNLSKIAFFGGLAYILESTMGTIFISPHFSLFLFYMAIISE